MTPERNRLHPAGGRRRLHERFLSVSEIVHRIVTALQPEKIIPFGSYAYSMPSRDSDMGLLIVLDTPARPVDCYLAVSRLLRPRLFPPRRWRWD